MREYMDGATAIVRGALDAGETCGLGLGELVRNAPGLEDEGACARLLDLLGRDVWR